MAEVRYFLKIDGVDGGSNDAAHKGEIELISASWGATSSVSGGGGGGSSGKVRISDIHVVKHVDKSSAALRLALASGTHFGGALLTMRKAGQNPVEFWKIKMSDVMITSFLISGGGGRTPVENITLSYAKREDSVREAAQGSEWHKFEY